LPPRLAGNFPTPFRVGEKTPRVNAGSESAGSESWGQHRTQLYVPPQETPTAVSGMKSICRPKAFREAERLRAADRRKHSRGRWQSTIERETPPASERRMPSGLPGGASRFSLHNGSAP
jgi:hypothetical protein